MDEEQEKEKKKQEVSAEAEVTADLSQLGGFFTWWKRYLPRV